MSVELNWHSNLPILIATYSGIMTPKAYATMCSQRRKALAERDSHVILLLDMQQLEGVRDAQTIVAENPLCDRQVYHIVIILADDLYERVVRARVPEDSGQPSALSSQP